MGQSDDALVVAFARDEGTIVTDQFLDARDLARALKLQDLNDRHGLVEAHLLSGSGCVDACGGERGQAQFSPRRHHICRPVWVRLEESGVGAGRLCQLFELLLQFHDLSARFYEHLRESFVLRGEHGHAL